MSKRKFVGSQNILDINTFSNITSNITSKKQEVIICKTNVRNSKSSFATLNTMNTSLYLLLRKSIERSLAYKNKQVWTKQIALLETTTRINQIKFRAIKCNKILNCLIQSIINLTCCSLKPS